MGVEFKATAVGIAHTYIEEAQRMKFDDVLILMAFSGSLPDEFTAPGSLGPESGETYATFDDIDDFNGYSANVPTSRADYDVRVNVTYSDTINFLPSINRSYFKIMSVMISSSFFSDTLLYNYLYSYY